MAALVAAASSLDVYTHDLPDEAKRAVELAVGDLERLRRLVEDLIDMAEIESGDRRISPEPTELRRFLDSLASAHDWRITIDVDPSEEIDTDRTRLRKIVTALVENALDRSPEDVVVSGRSQDDTLELAVSDAGPPIPPELLGRAFDRWPDRLPLARRGTGLGLALAHSHAEILGGRLTVARAGPRTIYTLSL